MRRGSKSDPEIPSQWVRQQFLGQPPIRRAYHSAHRVLVGGKERIVIYGGEGEKRRGSEERKATDVLTNKYPKLTRLGSLTTHHHSG